MRHFLLWPVAVLAACNATRGADGIVIPYENGRLVSTATARTERDALGGALEAAKDHCGRDKLAVVKQQTEYKGVLSKEVVRTAEQLEKIILEGADKVIPDLASDEDYKVSIEFRCGG